jgi:hypothetical protein
MAQNDKRISCYVAAKIAEWIFLGEFVSRLKRLAAPYEALAKYGAGGRNRTTDAELFRLTLYH